MTLNTPSSNTALFDAFDTRNNPTLEKAKRTLQKLSELIIANNGSLGEPMIVGLHGDPWLGKSHLIEAFEQSIQWISGLSIHRPDRNYGFSQHQSRYKPANLIINDDLFQEFWSLNDVFEIDSFLKRIKEAEVRALPEFLFDLYDGKKIWIVSSNFDIKDMLHRVAEQDTQWRLKSRIEHLLATTGVLHLEWEDYRKVLAKTGTRFSNIFQD